jgi:hypothetical protein
MRGLWPSQIAIGHLLSIAAAVEMGSVLSVVIDPRPLLMVSGGGLILWALYHLTYGSRHPARIGMQAGLAGLLLWSFLMASAHGAGLMLVPPVFPLCFSGGEVSGVTVAPAIITSLAAVGLHTTVIVIVSGIIAILVYDWIEVGFLRRGWINFDWLWTPALGVTGIIVLALTRHKINLVLVAWQDGYTNFPIRLVSPVCRPRISTRMRALALFSLPAS